MPLYRYQNVIYDWLKLGQLVFVDTGEHFYHWSAKYDIIARLRIAKRNDDIRNGNGIR